MGQLIFQLFLGMALGDREKILNQVYSHNKN